MNVCLESAKLVSILAIARSPKQKKTKTKSYKNWTYGLLAFSSEWKTTLNEIWRANGKLNDKINYYQRSQQDYNTYVLTCPQFPPSFVLYKENMSTVSMVDLSLLHWNFTLLHCNSYCIEFFHWLNVSICHVYLLNR